MKKSVKIKKKISKSRGNKVLRNFIIIGITVLILLFVFAMYSGKREADREDELASIWDIGILSSIGNFFGFGGSGGGGSGTGPVPGSDYSSFEKDLSSESCKQCELTGKGIVRSDIRADMSDPYGISKKCYGEDLFPKTGDIADELGPGTEITGVYSDGITTTPVTCPCPEIKCCDKRCSTKKGASIIIDPSKDCKRCKLPANCYPGLGTPIEDAEMWWCDFKETEGILEKIENEWCHPFATIYMGLKAAVYCGIPDDIYTNIYEKCVVIADPLERMSCVHDEVEKEVMKLSPWRECQTQASCTIRLLKEMGYDAAADASIRGLCGHTWTQVYYDLDSNGLKDRIIIDGVVIVCKDDMIPVLA